MRVAELIEMIKGRRSIRNYEPRDVSEAMRGQLIEAIRWAPSRTNCQCWEVVVIRDPAVKAQLQATQPPKGNPAFKAIVQAPVLLARCAKKRTSGFYKDVAVTRFGDG